MRLAPIVCVLLSAPLAAAASDRARDPNADVQHGLSITISPIHLLLPVVEVTGEGRIAEKVGAGAILGLGRVGGLDAFEGGMTVRYYPIGTFIHGMQLGAEGVFTSLSGTGSGVSATASSLGGGAFLGYKVTSNAGLTFEVQGGAQYLISKAIVTSQTAGAGLAMQEGVGPLLNLNVGWSF